MRLALFDFDGTLTTKDSLEEFLIFYAGKRNYYLKLMLFSPIFMLYKLKLMDNSKAKERLFRLFFRDIKEVTFKELALRFSHTKLDSLLRDDIYKKFQEHIQKGDRVIIVSASIKCWLEPWAVRHNVELLCTELEFIDGHFSGHFSSKNCHGEEKLRRVEEIVSLNEYEEVFTYGDSSGDEAILSIADHKIRVK